MALGKADQAPEPPAPASLAGRGRRFWLLAGAGLAATTALLLTIGLQPGWTTPAAKQPVIASPAAPQLARYESCPQLLTDLRNHALDNVTPYGLPGMASGDNRIYDGMVGPSAPTGIVVAPGIDEPGIVKTETIHGGTRVISLANGILRVIDAGSRQVTGSLSLKKYTNWQDPTLLVSGDHAVVLLGGQGNLIQGRDVGPPPVLPTSITGGRSIFLFVDLAGQPKVTGALITRGFPLDARLTGSTVRLAVHSEPDLTFVYGNGSDQIRKADQRIIRQAPLSAWLPQYTIIDGTAVRNRTAPCDQISRPARFTGASMLTVYSLNLLDLAADPQPIGVAADAERTYLTASSLYLASTPSLNCCAPDKERTELHRFDLSGAGRPVYRASGVVPGSLFRGSSLSEYGGSLRVATNGPNLLYLLRSDTLELTGQLPVLGPGHSVTTLQFVGPRGYLLAPDHTTPLRELDLHDPAAPKLAGALSLAGPESYLHDAGNSRLIGVSQHYGPDGRRAGVQVSLLEVADSTKPELLDRVVQPDAASGMSIDPQPFTYGQPSGLVVVPIDSWNPNTQSGKVWVLQVAGSRLRRIGTVTNPVTPGTVRDGRGILLGLLVDGKLWTMSTSGILVSSPTSLAQVGWIPFS